MALSQLLMGLIIGGATAGSKEIFGMPNPVSNDDCFRSILSHEGFNLTPKRAYGQTGVDIVARKEEHAYHIEVIGYKQAGPARAKDFYESFFRAVSRLNDGAKHVVLALSHLAESRLPTRAK